MKLYTFPPVPNPSRVGFYLREKGIQLETVLVDFRNGEQNSSEHLARNPAGTAPVLELDDGAFLTESLAIIEYLEEVHPDPPMIGTDPLSRARTREAERDIEFAIMLRIIRYVHAHKSPLGLPPNQQLRKAAERTVLHQEPSNKFYSYLPKTDIPPIPGGTLKTIQDGTVEITSSLRISNMQF